MREVNKIREMSINESMGLGITLTNIEIQDIIKVIKFFENRGILLKKRPGKLLVKKENFSIFWDH